jgi:hypothetical protein
MSSEASYREDHVEEATETTRKSDLVKIALQQWQMCSDAEADWRKKAKRDFQFRIGGNENHWDPLILADRIALRKPVITINRTPQFVNLVMNEMRQQRPAIVINPVGSGADVDTAEMLQGTCRHIENQSNAEVCYDTGGEAMLTGGKGYWTVETDYTPGVDTFEQEIFIKPIRNPFRVYTDPSCQEPDESDADFKFVIYDHKRSEFQRNYPDAQVSSEEAFNSIGDNAKEWVTKDGIRVAKYYYRVEDQREIAELSNGKAVNLKDVPKGEDGEYLTHDMMGNPLPTVKRTRKITTKKVKIAVITALDVLEEKEWPGSIIPVIADIGNDIELDEHREISGIIRNCIGAQLLYNFSVTQLAEGLISAPKHTWTVAEGQTEGHEKDFELASRGNIAVLTYKAKAVDGVMVPAPALNNYEPPVQALVLAIRQADNDLKATSAIYDASLGQRGPDESGKAILARQKQSDISNLNYTDNHSRAIKLTGKVLLEIIPHVYDTPRIQRILNPDGTVQHVGFYNSAKDHFQPWLAQVKQQQAQQAQPQQPGNVIPFPSQQNDQAATQQAVMQALNQHPDNQKLGIAVKKVYDIGVGRYDVNVDVGPSYQSKRQESVAAIMALIASYPAIMPLAGDLLIGQMDWPMARELAERLRKQLPPNLIDNPDQDPEIALQQAQQQLIQGQQQLAVVGQQLIAAQDVIKQERVKYQAQIILKRMDIEQRNFEAWLKSSTTLTAAEITTKAQQVRARLQADAEAFFTGQQVAHEAGLEAEQRAHEVNLQGMDQAHEQAMAAMNPPVPPQGAQPQPPIQQ